MGVRGGAGGQSLLPIESNTGNSPMFKKEEKLIGSS